MRQTDKPQTRQRMRAEFGRYVFDLELSWDADADPVWIDVACAEVHENENGEYARYTKHCATGPDDDAASFEEADKLFTAAVKWDGCAHWDLNLGHTCGDDEPMAVFAAHAAAYDAAKDIMTKAGTWDGATA